MFFKSVTKAVSMSQKRNTSTTFGSQCFNNCSVSKLLLTSKTDDYSATDGESQQKEGGSWEYRQLANVFTVTKEGESSI